MNKIDTINRAYDMAEAEYTDLIKRLNNGIRKASAARDAIRVETLVTLRDFTARHNPSEDITDAYYDDEKTGLANDLEGTASALIYGLSDDPTERERAIKGTVYVFDHLASIHDRLARAVNT